MLQERHARQLERALARYFAALAARAVRRWLALAKQVGAADLVTPQDDEELARIMARHLSAVIEEQSALAGELVGVDPLAPGQPGYQLLQREVAARVVNINAATRAAIQRVLRDGLARGYTAQQMAQGVPDDSFRGLRAVVRETYANRAQTIARTEVGHIAQRTTEDRYRAGGVHEVDISDGPDCGWTEHDDPDIADGSRRTLAELHANPLSHPNCVRVPLPVVEL